MRLLEKLLGRRDQPNEGRIAREHGEVLFDLEGLGVRVPEKDLDPETRKVLRRLRAEADVVRRRTAR